MEENGEEQARIGVRRGGSAGVGGRRGERRGRGGRRTKSKKSCKKRRRRSE